jgi:chemotaxis response regulator CheB
MDYAKSYPDPCKVNGRNLTENGKLSVLIVSRLGAHQKAIQAICASFSRITSIETATNTHQALEMVRSHPYDLLILGANLVEDQACDLLNTVKQELNPPLCLAITLSEYETCINQYMDADRIISTNSFTNLLPEILNEVYAT